MDTKTTRIFLYAYMTVDYFNLLFTAVSSTLVVLQYVEGKFFEKRVAVHRDRVTMQKPVPVLKKTNVINI